MMTKEEYEKEIVRMWDSVRESHKEEHTCGGVACDNRCPLYVKDELGNLICWSPEDCFEVIKAVEKWSKEHPPKKHKVSRMEYDILQIYAINHISNNDTFNDFCTLRGLLDKGYFEGATGSMYIGEYYINCEVVDDD